MRPVRRLMKKLLSPANNEELSLDQTNELNSEIKLDKIKSNDINQAIKCTKPSNNTKFISKYEEWKRDHGAEIEDNLTDSPT